jgi:subtilisin family serine protease
MTTAGRAPLAQVLGPDHPAIAGRTGRGVSVAVIDSGANPRHPHVRVDRIGRLISIMPDGSTSDDAVDRLGHGTAVTAAIQEKAPDADLHLIRVFHDRLSTTITALVRAIDEACEFGASLINLSLGTTRAEHADALAAAVTRARGSGAWIVAARGTAALPCYPGDLPGVFAVALDPECPRNAVRLESGIWHASGFARPIPGVPPEQNLNGISFAVANTTGVLACALEAGALAPVCLESGGSRGAGGNRGGAWQGHRMGAGG